MMIDENQVAVHYVARRALRTGTLPSTFKRMVTNIDRCIQTYQRVAYHVETREIYPCSTPGHGTRRKDVMTFPSGAGLDPWAVDAARLREESVRVSQCPRCDGAKKEVCATCSGVGKVACTECGGGGKVAGQRGPKNCPSCRGRGTAGCPSCRSGLVECRGCEGVGRVNAWLDVRRTQSTPIRADPPEGLASLHRGLLELQDFDADPSQFRNALIADSGWTRSPPAELRPELMVPLDARTDRIVGCRVQDFGGPVVRVAYGTRLSAAAVAVGGSPLGLLPETSWKPLERRGMLALATGAAVFVGGLVVRSAYMHRAPWFEQFGATAEFGVWAAATGFAVMSAVLGLLLPRTARRGWRVVAPAGALVACCVALAVLWLTAVPTADAGNAALARGDVAQARAVAEALVAESRQPDDASQILAAIEAHEAEQERARKAARATRALQKDVEHLARVEGSTTPSGAGRAIAGTWNNREHYEEATEIFRQRAAKALGPLYVAADEAELRAIATEATTIAPQLAAMARVRADLIKADRCRADHEFRCAADIIVAIETTAEDEQGRRLTTEVRTALADDLLGSVGDPRQKTGATLQQEKVLLEDWIDCGDLYVRVSGEEPPENLGRARKRLAVVTKKIDREADRLARQEARQARAAARAERRERQRSERTRKSRSSWGGGGHVQCCDGTTSPTCTYAHRGCCSHHGGVC